MKEKNPCTGRAGHWLRGLGGSAPLEGAEQHRDTVEKGPECGGMNRKCFCRQQGSSLFLLLIKSKILDPLLPREIWFWSH